jgi:serine/threonine-protein kinase
MLTGRPPFAGESASAVTLQHLRADSPWPSSLTADIPEAVDALVLRALAKDPDGRFQSAGDMRWALAGAAAKARAAQVGVTTWPDLGWRRRW